VTVRLDTGPGWGGWGNPVSPSPCVRARPSRGQGRGETRFPHTSAPAVYVHVSRPRGSAAQRRDEHTVVPGRAAPSQTLPRVGAWGNPGSPCPCGAGAWGNPGSPHPSSRAYVHVRETLPEGIARESPGDWPSQKPFSSQGSAAVGRRRNQPDPRSSHPRTAGRATRHPDARLPANHRAGTQSGSDRTAASGWA